MPTAGTNRVLEKLEATRELPTIPAVLVPLLRCMEKPWDEVDMHEIVHLIAQDKSLAARSLQVANSPLFGCTHQVEHIQSAVLALALDRIQQIAVSWSLRRMLPTLTYGVIPLDIRELSVGYDHVPRYIAT